jgi:hypothetical protein
MGIRALATNRSATGPTTEITNNNNNIMMNLNIEITNATYRALKKTINKFKEHPYYFFTEADIRSYFYYCLYSSKHEIKKDNERIYLVHQEYPTNFRYRKNDFRKAETSKYYELNLKIGRRGNYDMAIMNPEFVLNNKISSVINKNIIDVETRFKNGCSSNELLFAMEFKLITSNKHDYIEKVFMDNEKLRYAKEKGVQHPVNIVFCNLKYKYIYDLKELIRNTNNLVNIIFINSYFDSRIKKLELITNNNFLGLKNT